MRREDKIEAAKLKRQVMDSAETAKDMAKDAAASVLIKTEEGLHSAGAAVKSKVDDIKKGSGNKAAGTKDNVDV